MLWRRPAATVLIRPLAWEAPYAECVALEKGKKTKKTKKKKAIPEFKEGKKKRVFFNSNSS